ncbi:MAG: hypothetical protein JF614_07260 [Acidobacteria bacterium]|nr:hypothetical protein [Acidobacteriota bacterium]
MRLSCESDKGLILLERETRFLGETSQKPSYEPCRLPDSPPLAGLTVTRGDSWVALDFLGRRFLLFCLREGNQGAVAGAFERLLARHESRVNLVPLHVEGGLLGQLLCQKLRQPRRASLWLPWGAWERLVTDLQCIPRNPPMHVGTYYSDRKGDGGLDVVGFDFDSEVGVADEGSADKGAGFFEGVSMHFALIPHLELGAAVQVSLLANDQQLTVAPDKSFGLLEFIHDEGRAKKIAEALQDQYARWLISNPALRDAIQKRSRQLLLWRQRRPVVGWATNGQWGIQVGTSLAEDGCQSQADLSSASRIQLARADFVDASARSLADTSSAEGAGDSPTPVVMMLCGIPEMMTRMRSDLLGPLSSPRAWPQSDAAAPYQPSVLAEHLLQIGKAFSGDVDVFLFTTPVLDTHIRAHLEDELKFARTADACWEKDRAGSKLRVTSIRQPIHVNTRSPHADGGYKLSFGDHFDALGALQKWWQRGTAAGAVILSHNHSPFLWSGIRSAFEKWYATQAPAAVTVYDTVNGELTEAERKRRSYLARTAPGDKPVLRFAARVEDLPETAFSSSNVWFIQRRCLDDAALEKHLVHAPFLAMDYEGRPPRLDDLPDVVRVTPLVSTDDFPIYVPQMRKPVGGHMAGSTAAGMLRGAFLIEPAVKRNVWGGPKIADAKRWEPDTIGETWEISTHPDGPATVRVDARLQPLSDVAGCENLDFMGKFLDCQEALSIQLHPSQKAIDKIGTLRSAGCREGESAKEESFYVITPALGHVAKKGVPQHRTHLVLGFDREIVGGMVDTLRPWIVSHAPDRFDPSAGGHGMKDLAGEVWRIVTERFVKPFAPQAEPGPGSNDAFCRALAFYQDEHEIKGTPHGKEFLFIGCGLVELLRWLKEDAADLKEMIEAQYTKHKLETNFRGSAFLCMFYSIQVAADRWYRVPAGTVHSWQGGGNLIVELSNRSDATLRLVDFGREFSGASSRPMHYEAALFSLTEHSFVADETLDQYVVDMRQAAADGAVCHKDLQVRHRRPDVGSESAVAKPPMNDKEPVFYMNLGGPVRVDAVLDGKSLTLPSFSTLVTSPGSEVDFQNSGRGDDDILEISKRSQSRRSVAVTSHRHAREEHGFYEEGAGLQFPSSPHPQPATAKVHVVPGHRSADGGFVWARDLAPEKVEELRRLAAEPIEVLADSEAAALGEAFHPLGGLSLKGPGMILHLGDGFCAGFWDPEREATKLRSLWADLGAVGAVGRWLAFDIHTGKLWLGDLGPIEEAGYDLDELRALAGDDLRGELCRFLKCPPENRWPRVPLSWWLSSDAILLRAQALLGGRDWATGDWCQRYQEFHSRPLDDMMKSYSEVLRCSGAPEATLLIREVGNEIGTVARIVDCVAREFQDLAARSYLENVVLTGWPAANFGWVPRAESGLFEDVLVETANEAVARDLGKKAHAVKRSQIINPIVRETAGAVAYACPELGGLL